MKLQIFYKNADIQDYREYLTTEYHYQYLPTLYNLLAYNYANCLKNFRTWTEHPFSCTDTNLLTVSEEFIRYEIPCPDSLSSQYQLFRLFQKMEKANLESNFEDAAIFWNVERLKFIENNFGSKEVKNHFIHTLHKLEAQHPHSMTHGDLCVELAYAYLQRNDNEGMDSAQRYIVKAGLYNRMKDEKKTWREWFESSVINTQYISPSNSLASLALFTSRQRDSIYLYVIKPYNKKNFVKDLGSGQTIRRKDFVFDTVIPVKRYSGYGFDTTLFLFPPVPDGYYHLFITEKDGRATMSIRPYREYNISHVGGYEEINEFQEKIRFRYTAAVNTDRRIYRPGQTVHFKAIIDKFNRKNLHQRYYKNKKVLVSFWQNRECLFMDTLRTNEFGSLADSCVLPENVQPGNVMLKFAKTYDSSKRQSTRVSYRHYRYRTRFRKGVIAISTIRVEEYKRPQFEITLEEPMEAYALGDSVRVQGNVKAYAGFASGGTEISYVVQTSDYVAKTGTTTADDQGHFELVFSTRAMSDYDSQKFEILATATDITGETHDATLDLQVNSQPFRFQVNLPELYFEEEMANREIAVHAVTGDGNLPKTRVNAHYSIEKVTMPQRFMHKTPFFYRKSAESLGPQFSAWDFNNETLPDTWPGEGVIAENDLAFSGTSSFVLPSLASGTYRFVIKSQYTENKYVTLTKYFSVGHVNDTISPKYDGVWAWVDKEEAKFGDTLHFHVGTSLSNATIYVDLFDGEDALKSFNVTNAHQYAFDYVVKKEDTVHIQLIANTVHLGESFAASTETQLRVLPAITYEWETFRSDMQPGEQATFRLRLTNSDGTPTQAEVLCLMYDVSLDAIMHNVIFDLPHPAYHIRFGCGANQYDTRRMATSYFGQDLYRSPLGLLPVPAWRCGFNLKRGNVRYGYERTTAGGTVLDAEPVLMSYRAPVWDAESTATVRGARSDGQKVMIDGIVVHKESGVYSLDGEIASARDEAENTDNEDVALRTNFAETAFFYPFLRTDENGVAEFKFTMPESLTRWKIQGLAHTQAHTSCIFSDELRTSKPLMVITNLPRFTYEGDTLLFSAKLVNAKEVKQSGTAELRVTDPTSGNEIAVCQQKFTVDSMDQYLFQYPVVVPAGATMLTFRFVGRSESANDKFSDGEERTIPVLTRRVLVSESAPFFNTKKGSKQFIFNKLPKKDDNLFTYQLVFTPQPAWNAVSTLPALITPEYESSDKICNQLIASAMLLEITKNTGMQHWLTTEVDSTQQRDIDARKQLWEANPWLCRVKTVEDENLQLAMLLGKDNLQRKFGSAKRNLLQNQNSDGGWPWFKGGSSSKYITRRILIELGRARQLGWGDEINFSVYKALEYDAKFVEKQFEHWQQYRPEMLQDNRCLTYDILQYLLARSYFLSGRHLNTEADKFYMEKLSTYAEALPTWSEQAMAALTLCAAGDTMTAKGLMEDIRRAAQHSEELGMFWNDEPRQSVFAHYYSSIERQTLMIEAFERILKDEESVREMKLWLLQQKRGQTWENSSITANACMLFLTDYQEVEKDNIDTIHLQIGNVSFSVVDTLQKPIWQDMMMENVEGKDITLTQNADDFSYGALMWQQWQDMDSITAEEGTRPLTVDRKLWRVVTDERGEVFQPITADTVLRPGDRVRVQLIVTTDRLMEYVWLKDLHSAAFDVQVLASGFGYNGVEYFRTVRDEAVNYFFEGLPKGKHLFEYTMFVTQSGTFSDGYAEVKCVYNPEFSCHSAAKGKVKIESK